MINSHPQEAIKDIQKYLHEVSYGYLCQRFLSYNTPSLFLEFGALIGSLNNVQGLHHFLFSIFLAGHATEEIHLRRFLPPDIINAFLTTGVLIRDKNGFFKTPGLAIINIEGLYLLVTLPGNYPTAPLNQTPVTISRETLHFTKNLPASLVNCRVLDAFTESGFSGLYSAVRSASKIVVLTDSERSTELVTFNAALNDLSQLVEVRYSNQQLNLQAGEQFEYVFSALPSVPGLWEEDSEANEQEGWDGCRYAQLLFDGIAGYLSDKGEGIVYCKTLGGQHSIHVNQKYIEPFAQKNQLSVRSIVTNKIPLPVHIDEYINLDIDAWNKIAGFNTDKYHEKIARWVSKLNENDIQWEFVYKQVIRFRKSRSVGFLTIPTYRAEISDPLMVTTYSAKLRS
jgi:16S rRNA G966 N2-methylase RsmD